MKLSEMSDYREQQGNKENIGKGDVLRYIKDGSYHLLACADAERMGLFGLKDGQRWTEPTVVRRVMSLTGYEVAGLIDNRELSDFEYVGHISEWKRQS